MGTTSWIVTVVALLLVLTVVGGVVVNNRRRQEVRELFGPEYRGVGDALADRPRAGSPPPASGEHDGAGLRPLEPGSAEHYRLEWDRVQSSFVDRPALALHEADTLITSVMAERGYPVESFDEQAGSSPAGRSANVQRYLDAHRVHLRANSSETSTDELRHAFVQYRDLFDELLRADDLRSSVTGSSDRRRADH
jgi:hypothetical protein